MTAMTTPRHQVASATARMRDVAGGVVDASVWSMTAAETASTLVELTRLEAQVVELKTRVAAHADELQVGTATGASSTANWLAHQTQQTRPSAAGVVRLGYDLDTHDHLRAALAHGDLRPEQARVIINSIKHFPQTSTLTSSSWPSGTSSLRPGSTTPGCLRSSADGSGGRRARARRPAESDLLEGRSRRPVATRLTMSDDGHGKVHGRFTLPTAQPHGLRKMLLALAAPKHLTATQGPASSGVRARSGWAGRSVSSSNGSRRRISPGRR